MKVAPHAPGPACVFARSYDRGHTLQLLAKDVDYELRESFESAMRFGRETLVAIGIDADRAAIVEDFIRTRDRLAVQQADGIYGGLEMLRTRPTPTPLSKVQHDVRALNMPRGPPFRHPTAISHWLSALPNPDLPPSALLTWSGLSSR